MKLAGRVRDNRKSQMLRLEKRGSSLSDVKRKWLCCGSVRGVMFVTQKVSVLVR